MAYRKITVDGKEYQYSIGKTATKIKGHSVVRNAVLGVPVGDDKFAITPAAIAEYIRTGTVAHTEARQAKTKSEIAAAKMRSIKETYGGDPESAHGYADDFLCEILNELGYSAVVDEFNKIKKWYS
jgi:hypothetical protein